MSKALSGFSEHCRHRLEVEDVTAPLDVMVFEGRHQLSQPFSYSIQFTSISRDIPVESVLGQSARFSLYPMPVHRLKSDPLRTVYGFITDFQRLSASRDEARYLVVLRPRIALLESTLHHGVYQDQSVPQIVEHILRTRHGFEGQHFQFLLTREYPRREQVIQFGESDLAFIQRLLAEVGIWYHFNMDDLRGIDVLELCDDQRHYLPVVSLPLVAFSGLQQGDEDCVWDLAARHKLVERDISVRSYNPRNTTAWMEGKVEGKYASIPKYGEAYHYAEPYREMGDAFARDEDLVSESGYFYARLKHELYLNDQTRLSGRCSSASVMPGQVLEVTGDAPHAFADRAVITGMACSAARDRSLTMTFEAIPYAESVCFRPAIAPKPVIAGTLPARITSTGKDDLYGHIDVQGRYKVNFLFDRHPWQAGGESAWLRLARPYAGDTHGLHFPLIHGTEVAVAFEQGDPDRPYIAHALHDDRHPDHVTLYNYRRNVLRTPANNKLRMEDDRDREHVKLSSDHSGKSQLNLGHLVDAKNEKRGAGFELRSDGHGALRAGSGLFISADRQPLAQGQMLEMVEAIKRLEQAVEQMQHVSTSAQTASAEPADLQAQMTMLKKDLAQLQSSVLLLSAPDGIALTSGSHLQLAAQDNLIVNAGAQADVSVGKRLFMGIGQGLSLFVQKLGLKLIANQGPVKIQARHDSLQLLARNALQITSTEDEIHITAKKKIILNGGGSYVVIEPAGIEAGTDGDMELKATRFEYSEGQRMTATHPEYPMAVSQEVLRFKVPQTGNAAAKGWAGMPYTLYADARPVAEGVMDETGQVQIDHQAVTTRYSIQMANGLTFEIPIPDEYRNPEQGVLANRGLLNHFSKTDPQVRPADHHADYRLLYEAALDRLDNKKGEAQ